MKMPIQYDYAFHCAFIRTFEGDNAKVPTFEEYKHRQELREKRSEAAKRGWLKRRAA